MNNKGQSLVIFILLIPVIFLIFAFIYDYSVYKIKKQELENITKEILVSTLKSNDNDKEKTVEELYKLNGLDINNLIVNYNGKELIITYEYSTNVLLDKIININYGKIKINMIAVNENNDIIIKE